MIRNILFGLYFTYFVKGQIISMKICTDLNCNKDCIIRTLNSNDCAICDKSKGPCSLINPSSKTNTDTITFYSDDTCNSVIYDSENIPILMGAGCNKLETPFIGSYDATNVSILLYVVISCVLSVLLCLTICICIKKPIKSPYLPLINPNTQYKSDYFPPPANVYYPSSIQDPINYTLLYQPPIPSAPID